MKNTSKLLTCILLMLLSVNAFAELQRLSILPQGGIKISGSQGVDLKTICIDYYRDAPSIINLGDQAPYNQVYTNGDVVVKIDGILTNRSFQSLIQSENPLLLLQPTSHLNVTISINPLNPESEKISSIELEFKTPTEIGNIKEDRNVSQAQEIFENWGATISQNDFWRRAKCLDILSKNNKAFFTSNKQLTTASREWCDKLFNNLDVNFLPEKSFKFLVENNYFVFDENLNLIPESVQKLQQAYYYDLALAESKRLNIYSQDIEKLKEELKQQYSYPNYPGNQVNITDEMVVEYLNISFKDRFYKSSPNLTKIDKENKVIRDTIIAGLRYVLMLAWKSVDFNNYVKKADNSMPAYRSNVGLLDNHPLFLTTKFDLEQWAVKNNLNNITASQSRERLMQLLGLPPNSTNDMFVEFWVKEDDLFRPAIDSSLRCSLMFVNLDKAYVGAFADYSKGSYKNQNILEQFPFTGLGYTYDYNPQNKEHVGLSEFVLKEGSVAYVRRTMNTMDYLKNIVDQRR